MNYLKQIKRVMAYTTYKGCIITQKGDGFYALSQRHDTIDQARATIDNSFQNLKQSIR